MVCPGLKRIKRDIFPKIHVSQDFNQKIVKFETKITSRLLICRLSCYVCVTEKKKKESKI